MPASPAPASASEWRKPVLSDMGRDVVREAMRARGKTVTALAKELGISRKHLSNVLNGHAPLVDPLLRRLGEATGVGAELLFALLDYGSDGPRPEPFGFLRGWIVEHGDLTEPMEGWEMLELTRVRLLLDTCALIALAEREPMRAEAVEAIRAAQASGRVLVPSVAALEVAQKMAVGKLALGGGATARAWFEAALAASRFRHVPITADMALAAYELPEPFHRDPADRLIIATARLLRAAVVTVDARILAYGRAGHVATLAY